MKHFVDKKQLACRIVAGSLVLAMASVIPQAFAQDATTRALEQKVRLLEDQLKAIQSELNQVKTEAAQEAQQIKEIEQVTTRLEENTARLDDRGRLEREKNHRVFFRGGWSRANETHGAVSIQSRVAPVGAQEQADRDAWYIGAGFDFSLTENAWGLLPKTEVLAELMFEYKRFGSVPGNTLANEPTQLAGGALNPRGVTVSQFTLTAAPKIKFLEGSKFRPWIIPAGLAIHVISPPSESITVLDPGVMFGAGAEYNIWKDIYIGTDARYQLTVGTIDGAKIDGLTVGGYIGMGF